MHRLHDLKGIHDVPGDQRPVAVLDGGPVGNQPPQLFVVVVGPCHCLLEDRRVGRDSTDPAINPSAEVTRNDPAATQVVEPGALALLGV